MHYITREVNAALGAQYDDAQARVIWGEAVNISHACGEGMSNVTKERLFETIREAAHYLSGKAARSR